MKKELKTEIGRTYTPKNPACSDNEIVGNYWRVWCDGDKYFYEYDEGHFSTKFKIVQISREDFLLLKLGTITDQDLKIKYC